MRLLIVGLFAAVLAQAGVVLTFEQAAPGPAIDQAYGDNVVSNPQGGNAYGVIGGSFTPDITVTYGAASEVINVWFDNFGDLTEVAYNEIDGATSLTIRFDAAAGFNVILFSFDLGGWNRTDYTLANVSVFDGSNSALFSENNVHVEGDNGRSSLDFGTGLQASSLRIVLNLSGLGGDSDNIGIDNIHFGQASVDPDPVPEPSTILLCAAGLAAAVLRRIR
jgi:hypothetical protein